MLDASDDMAPELLKRAPNRGDPLLAVHPFTALELDCDSGLEMRGLEFVPVLLTAL